MIRLRAIAVVAAALPFVLRYNLCVCLPTDDHHGKPESRERHHGPSGESHDHSDHAHHHGLADHPDHSSGGSHDHDDGPCCCESGPLDMFLLSDTPAVPQFETKIVDFLGEQAPVATPVLPPECDVRGPPPEESPHRGPDVPIFLLNCTFLC